MAPWAYTAFPVAAAIAGAIYTAFRLPGPKVVSAIQHLAAGVVFQAAAGELLPELSRRAPVPAILAGGAVGIVVMLLLRRFSGSREGPAGLIAASAADTFIDGLVLAVSFAAGQRQGFLLATALTLELLFLGLSIAGAFREGSARWLVIGSTAGVALAMPLGALVGAPIARLSIGWQTGFFAFGLIALLYLVTEELLAEAHEKPETDWGAALFFAGFLGLTALDHLIGT